jgi:acetyltransferase-like isoleucine patch superfamily enzyme
VGDHVFIGPGFISVSDLHLDFARPQLHREYEGVTIRDKARIGGRVLAFPGAVIGEETVVGAGSVVRGQLLDRVVYLGDPIRAVRKVKPGELLAP